MSLSLSFVVDDKDNDGPLGHSVVATYRIRQNIRGGKLSRFINNMHYVGKTFAVFRRPMYPLA